MQVGFILPSSEYLFDPFRGDPFTHFQILTHLEATFGSEIKALLIDLRGIKREFAIFHIPECDVYLHSVYTLDYSEQLEVVASIRSRYPKAIHIAGGPHAQVFTAECQKVFDSLVLGEGEEKIVCALRDYQKGKLEPLYRQEGPVDINAYPVWKRHFLPKSSVVHTDLMPMHRHKGFDDIPAVTAIFSRGCPYNCSFCAMQHHREDTPGIRFRTPELVKEEIQYLKTEYGIKGISLTDEICFPLKRQAALEHLKAIKESDIVWRGQCRVDGVTEELAALARESGCLAMGMGVESVSQRSLDLITKKIKVERAREAIKIWKKYDVETRVYLIIGLPGEPPDIVEKTWSFIEETNPEMVALSLFTVRPGTEVFRNPQKFGIKKIGDDWTKTMHLYGRYDQERPTLTFEYEKEAPWGPSIPSEQIVENYLELQQRLRSKGIANSVQKVPPEQAKPKHGLLTSTVLGA